MTVITRDLPDEAMTRESFPISVDRFLHDLDTFRNVADNTVLAYRSDLAAFYLFMEKGGDGQELSADEITTLDIKDFLATLRDDHLAQPKSISRMLSSLRQFFKWALSEGLIAKNPCEGLRNPKLAKKLPVYLLEEEISSLLEIQKLETDFLGVRDYTILVTFLYSGLRLSELRDLDRQHIDYQSSTLLVSNGKGNKQRLLPLHDELALAIKRYKLAVSEYRSDPADSDALFIKPDGNRMTSRAIGYAIERSMKRAGLATKYTPHKLRHTFATQLLHQGANLLEIKELLGHSQLSTTSIYTHTSINRLKNAVGKLDLMGDE